MGWDLISSNYHDEKHESISAYVHGWGGAENFGGSV